MTMGLGDPAVRRTLTWPVWTTWLGDGRGEPHPLNRTDFIELLIDVALDRSAVKLVTASIDDDLKRCAAVDDIDDL